MSEHPLKLRAIAAYEADLLSREGRRRVAFHLGYCDSCRLAHAEIAALKSISGEVRQSEIDLDFSKIERALQRESKEIAVSLRGRYIRRNLMIGTGGLAAAAALFFLFRAPTSEERQFANVGADVSVVQESPANAESSSHDPVEGGARRSGTFVAIAGHVEVSGCRAELGAALPEGSQIQTAAGSAHVHLDSGTSFAVRGYSTVRLERFRPSDVELFLEYGRVANEVETGTSYIVNTPPYRIRVQGTRFEVHREGDDVSVTLDEGIVEVIRDERLVRRMEAPDIWTSHTWESEGSTTENGQVWRAHQLPENGEAAATLTLLGDDDVVRWFVDDLELRGQEAQITLSPGEFIIESSDNHGRKRRRSFTLLPEGGSLHSSDLRPLRRPTRAHLDPNDIASVVNLSRRALQRCYERELRRNDPTLGGAYTLRVTVGADGEVDTVRFTSQNNLPPPMRNCLVRTASAWSFAPPGGSVSFDLPLNLKTR